MIDGTTSNKIGLIQNDNTIQLQHSFNFAGNQSP